MLGRREDVGGKAAKWSFPWLSTAALAVTAVFIVVGSMGGAGGSETGGRVGLATQAARADSLDSSETPLATTPGSMPGPDHARPSPGNLDDIHKIGTQDESSRTDKLASKKTSAMSVGGSLGLGEQAAHPRATTGDATLTDQTGERDAILLLVRPSISASSRFRYKLDALRRSCAFVRKRWIYLLVAAEPGEVVDTAATERALCPGHGQECMIKAIDVTLNFWGGRPADWESIVFKADPSSKVPGEKYPKWAKKTFSWGYRAMCDFWSRGVFEVPAISTLGYYMRMDDDSLMNCEMSPNVDPFDVMRAEKYDYGYYKFSYDIAPAHERWAAKYIAKHSGNSPTTAVVARATERIPYQDRGPFHVPSFYNNFELVRVKYFRSQQVREFNDAVAASRGIWEYRWGDAVQRFFQLALFSPNFTASVWCVPTTTETGDKAPPGALYYRHGRHVPTCTIGQDASRWGPKPIG